MGGIRSHLEDSRGRQDPPGLQPGKWRGLSPIAPNIMLSPMSWLPSVLTLMIVQTKTIETTAEALAEDNNPKLPPLMNPTMLEASDDLTNLSHLNEPAGIPA